MEKFKQWFWTNRIVAIYFLFSVLVELCGVFSVENRPYIVRPFLSLGILMCITGIALCVKSNRTRSIFLGVCLVLQVILDIAFVIIYDMTGQYFDFGMLNLRNDAFGILESISVNFITFYASLFFSVFFILISRRTISKEKIVTVTKKAKQISVFVALMGVCMTVVMVYSYNSKKVDKYQDILYKKESSNYQSYGIIGNLVNEFAKGLIFNQKDVMSKKKIDKFIYAEKTEETPYFGVSKDNNVVVILMESFEWFSFLNNESEFPNQINLTDAQKRELFPNLYQFYDKSVVMNNFHSKEKTDISETISIMGSYPSDSYVNYDYPDNVMPTTVPNILRMFDGEKISIRSFHDGFKSFYNREATHKRFGFEYLTDMYDMEEMSNKSPKPTMHNYMDEGERNLDSEMFDTCKDLMFPTDKRFYTYITTITSHGMYYERENLKQYREKLLSVYTPQAEDAEMENVLLNYMSAVMDLDKAIGIMMDDLESKGLLDHTTIVMFGDHNSYYQQLSGYVKDLTDYDTDRYYTDLYKVPLMIYDKNLEHQTIRKFTCTSDIAPTILDLLGIHTYSNLYYGNSVFHDKESVLYSRAYAFFVGEGVLARSMNNLLFRAESVTDEYFADFEQRSQELIQKVKYCDQLFYQNYFGKNSNYRKYEKKMREIN